MKSVGLLQNLPFGPAGIYSAVCWTAADRGFTMSVYISRRKTAPMPLVWNTLEDLRAAALSRGCTPAQFAYTVEVMGTETHKVANYLQRHSFMKALLVGMSESA